MKFFEKFGVGSVLCITAAAAYLLVSLLTAYSVDLLGMNWFMVVASIFATSLILIVIALVLCLKALYKDYIQVSKENSLKNAFFKFTPSAGKEYRDWRGRVK